MNPLSYIYPPTPASRERAVVVAVVVVLHLVVLYPTMAQSQGSSKPMREMKVTVAMADKPAPLSASPPIAAPSLPVKKQPDVAEPVPARGQAVSNSGHPVQFGCVRTGRGPGHLASGDDDKASHCRNEHLRWCIPTRRTIL